MSKIKKTFSLFFAFLFSFFLLLTCGGCASKTVYKLERIQYLTYLSIDLGEEFYGIVLTDDMISVTLNGESMDLSIDKGFYEGDARYVGQIKSYVGNYTETDTAIIALIPDIFETPTSCTKVGDLLYVPSPFNSDMTFILKKS